MSETVTERTYPIENIWLFKSLLIASILYILLGGYYILRYGYTGALTMFIYIIIVGISCGMSFLQKRNFHYLLEDQFLTLKQGVFNKQQRHIPYGVIQNVFIEQDLLDQLFGLATLSVENASPGGKGFNTASAVDKFVMKNFGNKKQIDVIGSTGNNVSIPGLKKQNAEKLKEFILRKMKDNPINDSQSGL